MAQAQLVTCIASVVPRADLLEKGDIERNQRAGGTSCSTVLDRQNSLRNCVRISTSRASRPSAGKRNCLVVRSSSKSVSISEAEDQGLQLKQWDPDVDQRPFVGSGVEFKLSDFELCSHVSVGLAGKVGSEPLHFTSSLLFCSRHAQIRILLLSLSACNLSVGGQFPLLPNFLVMDNLSIFSSFSCLLFVNF